MRRTPWPCEAPGSAMWARLLRLALVLAMPMALAACAAAPPGALNPATVAQTGAAPPAPGAAGGREAPAARASSTPMPGGATPALPMPAAAPAFDVAAALKGVADLLQDGNTTAALALVQQVLHVEPRNAVAQSYARQIETDPVQLLGREHYSHTVKPGESLWSIARERLREPTLFFALARYNNLRVPRLLSAGQVIRIPGKPPPPPPPPEPPPEPQLAPAQKQARIAATLREARGLVARQDLCAAVVRFERVLALEPTHAAARNERLRALELVERLRAKGSQIEC